MCVSWFCSFEGETQSQHALVAAARVTWTPPVAQFEPFFRETRDPSGTAMVPWLDRVKTESRKFQDLSDFASADQLFTS